MKETFYFSHDYTSRADEKIKQLLYETGMEGYGIYWAIIEDLYQNDNLLKCDFARLSYDYHCSSELVEKVILNFNLFKVDNNTFSSISIQKRLELRESKSLKAKQSAQKRWSSNANSNAVASKSHKGRNAIKESKGKEIKLNIDSNKLLSLFNSILGKKSRVISEKAKKQLKQRLKEGYTKEDIVQALSNAAKDQHHLDTNYKYLTLEFITRPDKLDRFVNMGDFKTKTQIL